MIEQQKHIIKKQILDLQLDSSEGSFEIQNKVSAIFQDQVIRVIDDLLSQYSSSDIVYRISTLEINLGNINIEHLEREFIEKIAVQLKQQLSENIIIDAPDFVREVENKNRESLELQKINPVGRSTIKSNENIERSQSTKQNSNPTQLPSLNAARHPKQLKTVRLLFPKAHLFIADYNKYLIVFFQQNNELNKNSANRLRLERWRGIFLTLLLEQNSIFEQNLFIQKHLLYIATTFRLKDFELNKQMEKVITYLSKQKANVEKQANKIITSSLANSSVSQDTRNVE